MTLETADAIADTLNGLLREGWAAEAIEMSDGYLVRILNLRGIALRVIHTPAEAAEFIREHLR